MQYQKMMKIGVIVIGIAYLAACNPTKNTTSSQTSELSERKMNGDRERPKPEEILSDLDANRDLKLSKEEAKGPLANDFSKIDINNDGYITLEELKNAPKPPQGGRPSRN